jgi:alpha-L-fucosidase
MNIRNQKCKATNSLKINKFVCLIPDTYKKNYMKETRFYKSGLLNLCLIILIVQMMIQPGCKTIIDKKQGIADSCQSEPEDIHRLDWFKEAKFGMFIHWGPYSQLAGEYNGRKVPVGKNAEWIMKELHIPAQEYRKLAHNLNPVKFDAVSIVNLAKKAGMKYIVITAKHHDGFAMYHSGVSEYNIYDWTSFKRDPLKELSLACKEAGIKFCVYYSHREDWDHPGGYGNDWDYDNDWGADFFDRQKFERYLNEKAKPQIRELLTEYGPLGLVWFDRGMYTPEQGLEFVKLVHDLQPSTLINGRVGHYDQEFIGDYQSMSDNGMPPGGIEEYWETPMTLNNTWGFSKSDTLWKSQETVIQRLVEVVSRGGNFLLNIGPMGNGEIPAATVDILNKAGSWIERNGEGIYGTSASPFGELPWGYCTIKGNKLFFFIKDWPKDGFLNLPGLQNKVAEAYMLNNKTVKLPVNKTGKNVRIQLPVSETDYPMSVVVLETEGLPSVDPRLVLPGENGRYELTYLTAITHGKAVTRFNRKGGFHISKWTEPEDFAEWIVNIEKPGKFRINITYSANKDWGGKKFELFIGNKRFEKTVNYTGATFEFQEFPVDYIDIPATGNITVKIRPEDVSDSYLMYLQSLALIPVENIKNSGWGVNF